MSPVYPGLLRPGSRGESVRAVQRAVGVSIDGVYGSVTARGVRAFQLRRHLEVDGIVGPKTWAAMFPPHASSATSAVGTDLRRALSWARAQVGTVEQPANSNRGPKISDWEKATLGYTGWAWCQAFANAVLVRGGGPQLKSAYTPQVVQWAREHRYGLKVVAIADRRPGDFIYFKWPGVSRDFCDHVGVYLGNGETVEGNTSKGSAGSQNNGGGVFVRNRGTGFVVAAVRPVYGAHA